MRGDYSENSDIDIHIIQESAKYRERGNVFIDGIEVEYFINPLNQMMAYLKEEKEDLRPTTADMLQNGVILYLEESFRTEITELINLAKEVMSEPVPAYSVAEIEMLKYGLDDITKDLVDSHSENNIIAYHLNALSIVKQAITTFFRIYRVKQEKAKRLSEQFSGLDPNFHELLLSVFTSDYDMISILALIRYLEEKLGGKRPEAWSYTAELTIN